jgi:UMF1 family MFS transporter
LLVFAGLGMVMTGSLYFVAQGQWPIALACFVLASIGFAGSNSLYDGLLVHVASPDEYDNVSAYGYALGYLGGALLFTLNTIMVAMPEKFGLASAAEAAQIAFLMVACWWALFSLPLLIGVREQPSPPAKQPVRSSLRRLRQTIGVVIKQRNLLTFLIAYWLYIDGVYTIIKMAVDYGLSQGLSMQHLVQAILITNFVGFPAALVFGRIGSRIGAQRGLAIALTVYIVVTLAAAFITTAFEFYVLAIGIGLVQGGVQSLSRSLYARLIPSGQSAEYFGFFNMIGKFSAILGPVIAGIVTVQTGDQRWGFVSILILFVSGFWLLLKVDPAKPASA